MVMPRHKRLVAAVLIAGIALLMGATATVLPAQQLRLSEAQIFFEFNSSAQDLGVQVFLDGEWESLSIFDPNGNKIFDVSGKGSVEELGLTELFFESVEPPIGEGGTHTFDQILSLFPEGRYSWLGVTKEGDDIVGTATLTHDIPDGPVILSPAEGALVDRNNTVISWLPVTTPKGIQIVKYQIIVEQPDVGGFRKRVLSIDVSAGVTSLTVPREFLKLKTDYIFEVLAKEVTGNQTITEGSFKTR
jgi:hypothetical protein